MGTCGKCDHGQYGKAAMRPSHMRNEMTRRSMNRNAPRRIDPL
jgi:hypothetical protein